MDPKPKGHNKLAATAVIEEPIEGLIGAVNVGVGSATGQSRPKTPQQERHETEGCVESEAEAVDLQLQNSSALAAPLLEETTTAAADETSHTAAAPGDVAAQAHDQETSDGTVKETPANAASDEPGSSSEAAAGDSLPALQSSQEDELSEPTHSSPPTGSLGMQEADAAAPAAESEAMAALDDALGVASPAAGASVLQAATPVAGGDGADAFSEEAVAGSPVSLSSMPGAVEQESSQAALLNPSSEASQRPRLSQQLSSFFTCSSSKQPGSASRERITKQQAGSSSPPEAGHPPLDFGAAAAELALLPRSKLLPLAQPEQALDDAAGMLGRQELPTLLTALVTLRRVAIHHHPLVSDSLADITSLLLECLHGGDVVVGQAALQTMLDLLLSFGNTMLRHCENRAVPQHSCMLGLLLAASCGRIAAVRHWANESLRYMAERLHQGRVIRLLEAYLEHPQPPVRHKAAEWLLMATYRPPDSSRLSPRRASPNTQRPPSPPVKWRE